MLTTPLAKICCFACAGIIVIAAGGCARERGHDRYDGAQRGSLKDVGPVRQVKPRRKQSKAMTQQIERMKIRTIKKVQPAYYAPVEDVPKKPAPVRATATPMEEPAKEIKKSVAKPVPMAKSKTIVTTPKPPAVAPKPVVTTPEPAKKPIVKAPEPAQKPVAAAPPPVKKPEAKKAKPIAVPPPVKKAKPAPAEQKPVAAKPKVEPKPVPEKPVTQDDAKRAETKRLIAQGKKLMAQGDILGARELFIKAMRNGSDPEAMKAYASTFGANFLGGEKQGN